MRKVLFCCLELGSLVCLLLGVMPATSSAANDRLRVIVETDIGGDADDQASLVRFLLYSNEWDVEAIIADRSVAARYEEANHEPVPNCQGDGSQRILRIDDLADRQLLLNADGTTDPDDDRLTYRWFVYPEPGTYSGLLTVPSADSPQAQLEIPADAAGNSIHIILEVTDNGQPPLTRYRRVVVTAR